MTLEIARRRPFIDETLQLVGSALGARQMVFYAVDERSNLCDFVTRSVPKAMHQDYLDEMVDYDPLHIRHIQRHDRPLARWRDAARYAPARHVQVYGHFLRRYAVVDALELLFRDGPAVVAGLNVAWTEHDPAPSAPTMRLAEALQRYIEFCLVGQLASSRRSWAENARAFGLSTRERQIAQLVCQGHTNSAIATCLDIELSTVKTHLLRIFDKCQVDSRAALVGRLHQFGG